MSVRAEAIAKVLAPIVVGAALLGAWAGTVAVGLLPRSVPSPDAVITEFFARGELIAEHAMVTGMNSVWGLVIGALTGIAVAALAAAVKVVDWMAAPVVAAIAVVPIVALTPVFNTMFGASSQTGRILVAAIAAFIPVYVNSLRGLHQAPAVQRDLFRATAAGGGQTLRKLTLPTAAPYVVTGVRIASSLAVISALVAEYFGGPNVGLGISIASYAKSGRAALAWALVGAAIIIGLVFFLVTALVERIVAKKFPT